MTRLSAAFAKGHPALVCFVTAGDGPTPAILDALVEGGADVIELGMPFTDPMADGPAIQQANLRSLAAGTTTADILRIATEFRARYPQVPLVLMGYANPMITRGAIEGRKLILGVQDFAFMGGSMGMGVGAAFVAGANAAIKDKSAYVICTAAGGARMQEGILSLMQMPKTTVAVRRLRDAGLPYIVVLTDPTTGGVTASYAMLGDIHIAEPGALIGFAGQRVIQDTIREKLPEGFQRAEYLQAHGMVDMVVARQDLRATLAQLLGYLKAGARAA